MARFECLTDIAAQSLPRAELLDRAEAEMAYWTRKTTWTGADRAAYREFGRILRTYVGGKRA